MVVCGVVFSARCSVFRMAIVIAKSSSLLTRRFPHVSFLLVLLNAELWILNTARADWQNLRQGDQSAQTFLNQLDQKKSEVGVHPFYQSISPESNYGESELVGRSQAAAAGDPATQIVMSSSDTRPQIKIDAANDPLLREANQVTADPLKIIGGADTQVVEIQQGGKTENINCEEPGEDSLDTCLNTLTVRVEKYKEKKQWEGSYRYWKERKSEKYGHVFSCNALRNSPASATASRNPDITATYKACLSELGGGIHGSYISLPSLPFAHAQIMAVNFKMGTIQRGFQRGRLVVSMGGYHNQHNDDIWYDLYPNIIITYEVDSHKILPDAWADNCSRLETRADQGLCRYVSRVCTQGPQTRNIEGVPITRPCWQETLTYACSYPAKDDCGPLRAKGCVQLSSACQQYVGSTCVLYQQTYQCKESPRTTFQIQGGNTPFCMDGNCRDQSWEPNDELMSSLTQLSILKEMQGQLECGILFKGTDNRCSKCILSFKDCCGSGKGWGNDLGFARCNADEKLLNKRRKAGLCHYVGTYCDRQVLGKCVKKKTSYCCFGSKLLKAFHEQGRTQIGMGWGEPKHPLCQGFTIEEIQRIDFSKLDLSEFFEDLMKNYNPGKIGNVTQQVADRLESIKGGMLPNTKQQPSQRKGGA